MKQFVFIILCTVSYFASAQNWSSLNNCYFDNSVRSLYADSTKLIIGGKFTNVDSITVNSIVTWDGSSFSQIGDGITDSGNPITCINVFNNEIYAGGMFSVAAGELANGLAKYNGTGWETVGNGFGNSSAVWDLVIHNDELYVGGIFSMVDTISVNGIAKWDGSQWYAVADSLPYEYTTINSICFINNEMYVGGNFVDLTGGGLNNVAKWNGSAWESLDNGIVGTFGQVLKIIEYKGELYAAGGFSKADGNVGNRIQKWDGNTWHAVGTGLYGINYTGFAQVEDMCVFNDELYVVGLFNYADSIPAQYVVKWDGEKWCGFGTEFLSKVNSVVAFRDTIYIGGGFSSINGYPISRVAKWIGGEYVDTCGTIENVIKLQQESDGVIVYPNPTTGNAYLSVDFISKNNLQLNIYNITGKLLFEKNYNNIYGEHKIQLDFSTFSKGLYFVHIKTNEKIINKKIIVQ